MSEAIQLERVSRSQTLPLSVDQYRLWFLHQLNPGSIHFNINMAFRILGGLQLELFELSFNDIVSRHEALRTVFQVKNQEPEQVIFDRLWIHMDRTDLRSLPAEEREPQAVQLMNAEAKTPFSLENGPLLRARLYLLSDEEQIVLFTIHHIIADFGSLGKIIKELVHFYTARVQGTPAELPPLPLQFADYAYWQTKRMQEELYGKQLEYWKDKLGGELPVLRMPLDRPRPPVMTHNGATQRVTIPAELTAKLNEMSRKNGVTLFMTLLAAYQTVLYRYTGQEDICIGTPITTRNRPELEDMIGLLINTLVLRTSLEGQPTFAELLKRTRKTAFGAFGHQDMPYEKLVEELRTERDLSHNLFFQAMLMHLNTPAEVIEMLPGVTIEHFEFQKKTTTFELNFTISEFEGGLVGSMDFNTDLYNKDTIERFLGHFRGVLEAVVDNPHRKLLELPILPEEERTRILEAWSGVNHRKDIPGGSVHELFAEQALQTPDAIAVRHRGRQLTYRELNEQANRLAHHLRGLGIGPNQPVGICAERSLELIVGLLGILKAGGAYVPIDPSYPRERRAYMAANAQLSLVLSSDKLAADWKGTSCTVVPLEAALSESAGQPAGAPQFAASQDDLMYIIYTSGSTGQPKGVMVPHRGVVNHCVNVIERFGLNPTSRVLQFTSISFDVAVQEIFPTLLAGATLVLWKDTHLVESGEFMSWLQAEGVTVLNLTTAYWTSLVADLKHGRAQLPDSLQVMVVGGEKVGPETFHTWSELTGGRVRWINDYGLTETTITAAMFEPEAGWQCENVMPVGKPLANVEIYILDELLQPVPTGVFGELYIGGLGIAKGYWQQPELTAARFVPHPFSADPQAVVYKTGDLARFLPDGHVEFLGRLDHQVKIRGYRVELGEIEAALSRHDKLSQAVVIPLQTPGGLTQLAAYLVLAEPSVRIEEIRSFLQSQLPDYMVPSHYVVLDHIPLTVNGKVDTAALPKPEQQAAAAREFVAARTPGEEIAVTIWSKLLGLPTVSVTDKFFEIGGNSLLATQVVSQAKAAYACSIPLRTLFEYPQLDEWVEQIERLQREQAAGGGQEQENCLVKLQQKGDRTPLFFVHPVGGSITCYFTLARQLGESQPFYALQAHGMVDENSTLDTVEKMAEFYLKEILDIQPEGPYRLGGWSMGGFIAYEMARKLTEAGQQVEQLALIDSYLSKTTEADAETILYNFIRQLAAGPGKTISDSILLSWKNLNLDHESMCSELKALGLLPPDTSPEEVRKLIQVYTTTVHAFKKYMPAPATKLDLDCVQLFRALDSHEEEGVWTKLVTGLSLHHVIADHFSIVHNPEVGRLIHNYNLHSQTV